MKMQLSSKRTQLASKSMLQFGVTFLLAQMSSVAAAGTRPHDVKWAGLNGTCEKHINYDKKKAKIQYRSESANLYYCEVNENWDATCKAVFPKPVTSKDGKLHSFVPPLTELTTFGGSCKTHVIRDLKAKSRDYGDIQWVDNAGIYCCDLVFDKQSQIKNREKPCQQFFATAVTPKLNVSEPSRLVTDEERAYMRENQKLNDERYGSPNNTMSCTKTFVNGPNGHGSAQRRASIRTKTPALLGPEAKRQSIALRVSNWTHNPLCKTHTSGSGPNRKVSQIFTQTLEKGYVCKVKENGATGWCRPARCPKPGHLDPETKKQAPVTMQVIRDNESEVPEFLCKICKSSRKLKKNEVEEIPE